MGADNSAPILRAYLKFSGLKVISTSGKFSQAYSFILGTPTEHVYAVFVVASYIVGAVVGDIAAVIQNDFHMFPSRNAEFDYNKSNIFRKTWQAGELSVFG